jgi:hypothetical protein
METPGVDISPSFSVIAPPSSVILKKIFGIVQFLPVMQSQQCKKRPANV